MILQALYQYAMRKEGLAPQGLQYKAIPFIIKIDSEGNFIDIHDNRSSEGKNSISPEYLVIKGVERTSGPLPNILWDNFEYVLGFDKKNSSSNKIIQKQELFYDKVKQLSEVAPLITSLNAVWAFYEKEEYKKVFDSPLWEQISKKTTENISFSIIGETEIIAEKKEVINAAFMLQSTTQADSKGEKTDEICLITGKKGPIVSTTSATFIHGGGQAKAKLVSFQVNSGFDSYGKEQGANAPISPEAEDAYITALKSMTGTGSKNKFSLGNRTYIFWTVPKEKRNDNAFLFENSFADFFGLETKDNPDSNVLAVKKLFESMYSGVLNAEGDDEFYVLGLAPNAARISVQYWQKGTVSLLAKNICQHFEDLKIVKSYKEDRPFFSLMSMILSVTALYKIENITPNLPDAVIRSILNGTPYPAQLQQACIRRIRAEQSVTYKRAAILKAVINRKTRFNNYNNEKLITMSLDKENKNQAYLCGRLFAVIEKLQEEANGGSSLATDYLTSASTTPAIVFPRLISLSSHHEAKLENKGRAISFNKLKCSILSEIDANGMPKRLMLDEQSRFMLGYYHQRQDFFTSKEEKENK
ncbi:MAG: type I-C CRISPR-associated protein Cas8c/Csd1 [Flavobacteriales bacterium]|nr:type I-C CRISPR-associated protein Cas8c/Csd1 [Flavobacteriales bacterium]